MSNSKGFTIVELLVGSVVLLIILALTTSFFVFQSRYSGELVKDTGTRETISLAMMMLKRDIMHAGAALAERPELSLWVDGRVNDSYHKLYVSYTGYLSSLPPPDSRPKNTDYTSADNVYSVYGNIQDKNGAIFEGPNVTSFTISARKEDVGAIVTFDEASKARQVINVTAGPYNITKKTTTFTLASAASLPFTPVISYRLVDPDSGTDLPPYPSGSYPELQRNGVCIAGGKKDRYVRITDFLIKCQFIASDGTERWVPTSPVNPDSTIYDFKDQIFNDLKVVEIKIKYRTLISHKDASKDYNWRSEVTRTANITPRNLVLAQYK